MQPIQFFKFKWMQTLLKLGWIHPIHQLHSAFNQTIHFGTDTLILKSKVTNIYSQFISLNQMVAALLKLGWFHPKHQLHFPFNQTIHFGTDKLILKFKVKNICSQSIFLNQMDAGSPKTWMNSSNTSTSLTI